MADQFINIAKPFLIGELTKQIKEHEKDFDVVESKIDSIITQLKTQLEPISTPIIAGIKLIPFGDPTEKLQELSDELKLKMDGIDFSELEKIPDIDPTLKDRIKALPDKVKTKLKDLVDELVTGKAPAATTPQPPPPSNTGAIMPPAPPSKKEEAAATTDTAAATTDTAAATTDTAAATTDTAAAANDTAATATTTDTAETIDAAKAGLADLKGDEKNETIDKIMKMLEETGVLDEIKKRICSAAPATTAAPAPAGGAKRKHRRKTKKNIRRNNNGKTRFGRTF